MISSISTRARKSAFATAFVLSTLSLAAQQPKVANSQFSVKSGNLQREIDAVHTPTWIGYQIATLRPINSGWDDITLHLEDNGGEGRHIHQTVPPSAVPPGEVLLRVTDGKVQKVRVEQMDREIDAGGLSFVWLNGVSSAESLQSLKSIVDASVTESAKQSPSSTGSRDNREQERPARRLQDAAIVAIAMQRAPEATSILRSFTATTYPLQVRDRAAFWLANERGVDGFKTVAELLHTDHDQAFREKLVFDLTLVRDESQKAAIDELLSLAKSDATPEIRGKAQFWLAQTAARKSDAAAAADPRIIATLGDQAKNDPNVAIRKSAVFALSRLPEGQGVPRLIEVASTTKDAATRREAIFWLGRSGDPQALLYLEKLAVQ